MPFPTDPKALTTEWFTRILRDAGAIQSANVTTFQTRELNQTKGMAARYILISLSYDTPESDAPRSLFAKFPRPNWAEKGDWMGTFGRESHFYRHLADRVVLRVPRCYYNALDETGFLLLLEDLSPARCGDRRDRDLMTSAISCAAVSPWGPESLGMESPGNIPCPPRSRRCRGLPLRSLLA